MFKKNSSVQSVPFIDLHATYLELKKEMDSAYSRVMDSGYYVLGPEVEAFEKEYAAYCGTDYCVGVSSGLSALELMLRAAGVEAGDEVIVPTNTFIATWLAVSSVGAKPVPVEPDEKTHTMQPYAVESKITSRTKVILPVHLYGLPAEMEPLQEIAKKHGIMLMEDAAQSQGARYLSKRTGSLSHAAGFSFYPAKNLGAFGDAGAITTSDKVLADKIRMLRNYGSTVKYYHEMVGTNARLDPLQAAMLRIKLKKLDEWNDRRRHLAGFYQAALRGVKDLVLPESVPGREHVWHLFVIRHPRRDALRDFLANQMVSTVIHYPVPPHLQKAYASLGYREGDFPISERLAKDVLSLPLGPHLTEDQAGYVADKIREFCQGGK